MSGGEYPREKALISLSNHLRPADYSVLGRSWLFKLRYPAPVPISLLQPLSKAVPSTGL